MPDDLEKELQSLAGEESWERLEAARPTLLRGLRSEARAARELALELVSELMNDEVAEETLKVLSEDPVEELRARAAIALGPALEECEVADFDDPYDEAPLSEHCHFRVQKALRKVYHDPTVPKLVRRRVLESATRAPQRWQINAVQGAFSSENEEWRTTAVFCMGSLAGFEKEILQALDDESPSIRFEAVRAAGNRELNAAGGKVYRVAGAEDAELPVRLAAIEALPLINPPGTRDLLEALIKSDSKEIATNAREALEELETWEFAEEFAESLVREGAWGSADWPGSDLGAEDADD